MGYSRDEWIELASSAGVGTRVQRVTRAMTPLFCRRVRRFPVAAEPCFWLHWARYRFAAGPERRIHGQVAGSGPIAGQLGAEVAAWQPRLLQSAVVKEWEIAVPSWKVELLLRRPN